MSFIQKEAARFGSLSFLDYTFHPLDTTTNHYNNHQPLYHTHDLVIVAIGLCWLLASHLSVLYTALLASPEYI